MSELSWNKLSIFSFQLNGTFPNVSAQYHLISKNTIVLALYLSVRYVFVLLCVISWTNRLESSKFTSREITSCLLAITWQSCNELSRFTPAFPSGHWIWLYNDLYQNWKHYESELMVPSAIVKLVIPLWKELTARKIHSLSFYFPM